MMRYKIVLYFVLVLPFVALSAAAQESSETEAYRQSLQEEIQKSRQQVREKGAVFLDSSRSVEERLEAVQNVSALINTDQIKRAKRLVDSDAPSSIRSRAIELTSSELIRDEEFLRMLLGLLADEAENLNVRKGVSQSIQSSLMSIHFTKGEEDPVRSKIFSTYRSLLDDSEQSLRRDAFKVLVPTGDSKAIKRLLEGLREPEQLPMNTAEALSLVGPRLPQDARAQVAEIMRDPPSSEAQVQAVRLLGDYEPVQSAIVGYVQDEEAPMKLRLSAARTLASNTPARFTNLARSIIPNDNSATELRIFAIEALRQQRVSNNAAKLTSSADDLDRAIQSLAKDAESEKLRAVAQRYVDMTYVSPDK